MNGTEQKHTWRDIQCSSKDCQSVTVNYTVSNIGPQMNYAFIASVYNHFNKSTVRNQSYFSKFCFVSNLTFSTCHYIATYHVQGLTLQYHSENGSVVVVCRFAERSTADGCHVIFRESSKGTVKCINITKSSIEESTVYQYLTLPISGNYTVTAHDIVDGIIMINPSVLYSQVFNNIIPLPSPEHSETTSSK